MSGGAAAAAPPHEVRVSACDLGRCGQIILRCSCLSSWVVESGHTVAELSGFAAQHAAGEQAPGRPGAVPLPLQGEGRPGQ